MAVATLLLATVGGLAVLYPSLQQRFAMQPSATPTADALSELLARPLALPTPGPAGSCPVSPVSSDPSMGLANARGDGPVFIGGPSPVGGYALNKMVYLLRGGSLPIMVRGARLDAAGKITFAMGNGIAADSLVLTHAPDAFYAYPAAPGCYALQVDGPGIQEIIVLRALVEASEIPPAAPGDTTTLLGRDLVYPVVRPGECPATPASSEDRFGLGHPRGDGPFYIAGQIPPKAGEPFNKVVTVLRGANGPVLVRGIRVGGGVGQLKFSGRLQADPRDVGEIKYASFGTWVFNFALIQSFDSDVYYIYPSTPGCYTIQVDGPDFRELIFIEAK